MAFCQLVPVGKIVPDGIPKRTRRIPVYIKGSHVASVVGTFQMWPLAVSVDFQPDLTFCQNAKMHKNCQCSITIFFWRIQKSNNTHSTQGDRFKKRYTYLDIYLLRVSLYSIFGIDTKIQVIFESSVPLTD